MAREFNRSDISKVCPVNGDPPEDENFQRLLSGGFKDWRLKIDGLVARPAFFSFGPKQKWGSLDMFDAWHPQTLLAYGMNGQELPLPHGARFACAS
jgi:DMSO/TMAO reductase YedYZ molybdopterin-dependent catalytic subunit